LFVAVVFLFVKADGGPAAAAHRPPPAALEAAPVRRLLPGSDHPLIDVAVEVVDPERRHTLRHGAGRDALIEPLELRLARRLLPAVGVLDELPFPLPEGLIDVALGRVPLVAVGVREHRLALAGEIELAHGAEALAERLALLFGVAP